MAIYNVTFFFNPTRTLTADNPVNFQVNTLSSLPTTADVMIDSITLQYGALRFPQYHQAAILIAITDRVTHEEIYNGVIDFYAGNFAEIGGGEKTVTKISGSGKININRGVNVSILADLAPQGSPEPVNEEMFLELSRFFLDVEGNTPGTGGTPGGGGEVGGGGDNGGGGGGDNGGGGGGEQPLFPELPGDLPQEALWLIPLIIVLVVVLIGVYAYNRRQRGIM